MIARWIVVASGLIACTARVGGGGTLDTDPAPPDPPPPPPVVPTIQCVPGDAPNTDLLRINRATYLNALTEVFGASVIAAIQANVEGLPRTRDGRFGSELGPPTFAEVSAYADIASAIAFEVTKDAASLGALRPCLSSLGSVADPQSDPCLGGLTDDLGRRVLRRPLSAEDRARFLSAYAIGGGFDIAEGVATLLMTMLLDPRFLYFFELDGTEIAPGVAQLTPHELAARLARVLWESVPDAELSMAADSDLGSDALSAQIDRLWQDDRAKDAIGRFYRELLELENLPYPPDSIAPDSAAKDSLRAAMEDDLIGFANLVTFERDGTFRDLLLDRTALVSSPVLAQIYGLDSMSGPVELSASQRGGVLTRAGWLMSAEIPRSNAGHVIKRGAKLGRFVCRELPPPDPNLFPADDPADPASGPDRGIRERFQAATAEPQCLGCHRLLDAFGGPFGHYGAAGQWIDTEEVSTEGATSELPIDDTSAIAFDAEETRVSGALAFSEALAASNHGPQCFATHLTRRMMGRKFETHDACLIEAARDALQDSSNGSIRKAFLDLLTAPEFATRRLP